jgi:thiamine-phosphate pyrophosphorylase
MATPFAHPALTGLYVILDPSVSPRRSLAGVLKDAIDGGARLFQYRNKAASMRDAYAEALVLRRFALDAGATFIVNDRCDLALAVDADGVHLGQHDLPFSYARQIMGPERIIGLSTHNPTQVREAELLKPDYLGVGPIFRPVSKADHDPLVGIEGLRQARALTSLPVFAIGGIRPPHVEAILGTGVTGIAVISAVLQAPDAQEAVRQFIERINGSGLQAV